MEIECRHYGEGSKTSLPKPKKSFKNDLILDKKRTQRMAEYIHEINTI